jgi:proline dehydrogenase
MLLGVRPDLRWQLLDEGERIGVYVIFGEKRRAYCLRRFRENRQILRHVTLTLFRPQS